MPPGLQTPPSAASATSPRVGLARLALDAALALPDVVAGEAGPHGLRVTADESGGLLRGVSVTAEGEGRYAVDLRLVAHVVPLVALAGEIQRRVRARADREGLGDRLGAVNVEFGRLITSEEALLEAEAALAAQPAATDAPPPEPGGAR
jgi:hypothetical protein